MENKERDRFISFEYEVRLSSEKAYKNDNGNYVVIYRGEEKIIQSHVLRFAEKEKITKEQAHKVMEGTKDIISITGDFLEIDKKYYTPEITEFHVGFECETQFNTVEAWKKEICDWQTLDIMCDAFEHGSKAHGDSVEEMFRVKYLDQEDIESLGFKHTGTAIDVWFEKEGSFEIGNWTSYKIRLHYGLHDHRMYINALDSGEEHRVFEGTIKNKSELKRILNMIGVGYDQ